MLNRCLEILKTAVRLTCLMGLAGTLMVATPAHGHRSPPANTAQSSFFQDACPGNLLVNPSFEGGGRQTEHLGTSLSSSVAHGWFPWFIRGDQRFNREPEFKIEDATRDPLRYRAHTGYFSQKFFTTWATHTAGIYQRVSVPPGTEVDFSIWVQIYTGEADGWDGEKHHSDPDAPGNYRAYVGIDPFGNTPPGAGAPPPDTVVWSEPTMTYDVWTQLSIQTVAQADHVTVYTRGQPEFSVKHNDSFWDTACLTVGGIAIPAGADAVVDTVALNFRAGPGTGYDIIDVLRQGDPLTVNARLTNNSWINVTSDTGTTGWVYTDLARLGIELEEVPIAQEIPPTPTPIPTDTPTPSPTPEPTVTSTLTNTPVPTSTPEPTQTPIPTNTAAPTTTPATTARASESTPPGGQQAPLPDSIVPGTNPPAQPQSEAEVRVFNCTPGLIVGSIGLLGLAIWSRRRYG